MSEMGLESVRSGRAGKKAKPCAGGRPGANGIIIEELLLMDWRSDEMRHTRQCVKWK